MYFIPAASTAALLASTSAPGSLAARRFSTALNPWRFNSAADSGFIAPPVAKWLSMLAKLTMPRNGSTRAARFAGAGGASPQT